MKVSTKLRYGLRAMIDIGINSQNGPVLAKDIAKRQEISKKYLDNLLVSLKSAGLIRSLRGARGGYVLAKPLNRITVEDIALALEGPPIFVDCVSEPGSCNRSDNCVAFEFWTQMSEIVWDYLRKARLSELVERQRKKNEEMAGMYYL